MVDVVQHRLDRCKEQMSAKLDVESDGDIQSLSIFTPVLDDICEGKTSISALLSCKPFDLIYSWKNIIVSISRK